MEEPVSRRFGSSDDADLMLLIGDKNAANTKKSTKAALNVFHQYLMATNRELEFQNPEDLCTVLSKFYADARKKNGNVTS